LGPTSGLPTFSAWMPWSNRDGLRESAYPGVYVLSHLNEAPSQVDPADPLIPEVIYIGETTRNTLKGRWRQFDRTAFRGKEEHYGGRTYRERIGGDGRLLHVSAWGASDMSEPERSAFIKYVERALLWEYVRRWGQLPECNNR